MKKVLILVIFIVSISMNSFSQDSLNNKSKWQFRPNFGANVPISKLLKGNLYDNFVAYNDNSIYWQLINVTYFFHKHWGVELNFQGMNSRNISTRNDVFLNEIQSKYENDYYFTTSSSLDNDFNIVSGNFERGFFGLIYRLENNKWLLYPKFAIGFSSFYKDFGRVYLKQKKSNNLLMLEYNESQNPIDNFTLAASTVLGYKISKRISINIEILASYFKTDFSVTKSLVDVNTQNSITETEKYNKHVFGISLGGGFIYTLK